MANSTERRSADDQEVIAPRLVALKKLETPMDTGNKHYLIKLSSARQEC